MIQLGFDIYNNPVSLGLNSIYSNKNNASKRLYFGNQPADSFQQTGYKRYLDENFLKKAISNNSYLQNLLAQNDIPIHLNIDELNKLLNTHALQTKQVALSIANNLMPSLKQNIDKEVLSQGAMLHDIGKVLIPSNILNKEGKLTAEEMKIMKLHSEIGYELLKDTGLDYRVLRLIKFHHLDEANSEYLPDVNVQILNLADKYSALTENRVYRRADSPREALTKLSQEVTEGKINPFLFNALVKSISQNVEYTSNKN